MPALRHSELRLQFALHLERLVIFRQPLVEPGRNIRFPEVRVDDEVDVFVKDRPEGLRVGSAGREGYVIDVVAGLKISGDKIIDLPVAALRFERPVRPIALEHDDIGRYRSVKLRPCEKESERFTKLLKLGSDAADLFFGRVADQIKVLRSDLQPFVFDGGAGGMAGRERQNEQSYSG